MGAPLVVAVLPLRVELGRRSRVEGLTSGRSCWVDHRGANRWRKGAGSGGHRGNTVYLGDPDKSGVCAGQARLFGGPNLALGWLWCYLYRGRATRRWWIRQCGRVAVTPIVPFMGRSPLGAAAKTLSVTVKVSENEKALLRGWGYRTPGLAARQALDMLIAQRLADARGGGELVGVRLEVAERQDLDALERVVPRRPVEVTTPCRIHRGYEVVKTWTEFGTRWQTKVCADCGYETSDQVHG